MSYLFHKTHEQSYVAHVIGYSMCIGPYANDIDCRRPVFSGTSNGSSINPSICICFSSELFALFFLYLIRNQCNIHVWKDYKEYLDIGLVIKSTNIDSFFIEAYRLLWVHANILQGSNFLLRS